MAFKIKDRPKDDLYKRCSRSVCAVCGEVINHLSFEVLFSEEYGMDVVTHESCGDELK